MATTEATAHNHTAEFVPAFGWAAGLNAGYIVEVIFGFSTGSLALLADAAHNLTDVAGLLLAWGAAILAQHRPSPRHTYGLGQATVLAALANAITILIGVGAIGWEAIHRFREVVDVPAGTVLWVAALGIAVNTGTALMFLRARHRDLNARGALLHHRTCRCREVASLATRGKRRPRPARLAAQHDGGSLDGASCHAGRPFGRQFSRWAGPWSGGQVRHRPYHASGRARRWSRLPGCPNDEYVGPGMIEINAARRPQTVIYLESRGG